MSALPRGAIIGVLGGGQLGRMLAQAAFRLGYEVHVFAPEEGSATQVCPRRTLAAYTDEAALAAFADAVDVVTCEFENVPASAAAYLANRVPVRPGPRALAICQDRVAEKGTLREIGLPTAPWALVHGPGELTRFREEHGRCVLKTTRFGYDGKGQARLAPGGDAAEAWAVVGGHDPGGTGLVEAWIDFAWEGSVIVARGLDGAMASYPLVENQHEHHILHHTLAPAPLASPAVAHAARVLAEQAAAALEIVGLLAVELFVLPSGELLVNELAARPHNSGHWTMDGAHTSQFEQCVRAITGQPLGSPALRSPTRMKNLLGAEIEEIPTWLATPGAVVHDYGKAEIRAGRKMGHVNLPLSPPARI